MGYKFEKEIKLVRRIVLEMFFFKTFIDQ